MSVPEANKDFDEFSHDEAPEEKALRPGRLDEFVGQPLLKDRLSVSIRAALHRKEPLDHVLLSGPPGLGKTTLACIVAAEMGGRFHSTSAPALGRPGDLARLLTLLEKDDVLFIDEIHRLTRQCEEILYPAMEDGFIDFIVGEGMAAQSVKVPLKPFTLVGATTRSGSLTAPLKSRFGIDLKLEFYDLSELTKIVKRSAGLLGVQISENAAAVIAERARMTPRAANRLLRRIRDYATVENVNIIEPDFALRALGKLGIDSLGLTDIDRKLLTLVIERYHGGPVGIRTLASLLDEEEHTIEEDHEPFMLRIGLLEKTPQGRVSTQKAAIHLGLKIVPNEIQQSLF
jgi:Holliday junction DNA helicase RuvB